MILDVAGQKKEAAKRFERAYKLDPTALRVVQSYGSFLSRQGNTDEALKVFTTFDEALPRHPLIVEAMNELKAGKRLPLMVDTPQAGAAEVLYGLGAALGRRGGEDLGLIYLQLSLYLAPSHPLALLSLADLYEAMKKPELANKIYERVPLGSPLHRNAQIQLALNLDSLDQTDEAKASLEKLIAANPADLEAIMALGNVLRGRKQVRRMRRRLLQGVDTLTKTEKANWVIYYFRGICFERSKQWAKAEADLKKALELFPTRPHVLNYLGYSWIDQGINLDEGMRMIKRAVEQRADDGYIVDSLGWAYYRLGNNEEAVKQLERAVELKPEDPTINDHLGDAYWRVGRVLEARFQWSHARDLKPEPEDLVKIEAKLKSGFPTTPPRPPRPSTRSPAAAKSRHGVDCARRKGARQGQSDTARAGPSRRRLSRAREPGRVRRRGRRLTFAPGGALTLASADRPRRRGDSADNLVLKAAARSPSGSRASTLAASRCRSACRSRPGWAAARRMRRRRCGFWRARTACADDPRLMQAAQATGADVPVCLDPRPRLMRGVGDVLSAPLELPRLFAVLINPGVAVSTRDVFAALNLPPAAPPAQAGPPPAPSALLAEIASGRNDLEQPAIELEPAIADVLSVLNKLPGCRLARMSGSGATCFGLFETNAAASAAARTVRVGYPQWWVRATVLGAAQS
jgi:Flp pilus assembly protein TadD